MRPRSEWNEEAIERINVRAIYSNKWSGGHFCSILIRRYRLQTLVCSKNRTLAMDVIIASTCTKSVRLSHIYTVSKERLEDISAPKITNEQFPAYEEERTRHNHIYVASWESSSRPLNTQSSATSVAKDFIWTVAYAKWGSNIVDLMQKRDVLWTFTTALCSVCVKFIRGLLAATLKNG